MINPFHPGPLARALSTSFITATAAVLLAIPAASRAQSFPLFLTNGNNATVEEYGSSGGAGTTFASNGTTQALVSPTGLVFDSAGNLYVTSFSQDSVIKFANLGGGVLSTTGSVFYQGSALNSPEGVAIDSAGDLFVSNYAATSGSYTIVKFAASGGIPTNTPTTFVNSTTNVSWNADASFGLGFDLAGNLYVNNSGNSTITKFSITTGVITGTTTFATSTNGVNGPTGMTFDTAGDLFVSDGGSNSITKFTATGGVPSAATGAVVISSNLSTPAGLALDPSGNLYVANSGGTTIEEFANNGGTLSTTGTAFASGTAQGVNGPRDVAFNVVPEPGSAVLLALGAAGILGWRRRRNGAAV